MSDDEADPELLALLRQSLGLGSPSASAPPETKVLQSAEHVYNNAIDVAISTRNTKAAAASIWNAMQQQSFSTQSWSKHELHPKSKDESTVDFIFTMDLLNFSFWSEDEEKKYEVEYNGSKWSGYWSMVAALRRALDEDIPITSSDFWQNEEEFTEEVLRHLFRSTTGQEIPLFSERLACLREAGQVLYEDFNCSFINCIAEADGSATKLVNLLATHFPCFRDETRFEGKTVRFYKRAQILVADLWACFDGQSYGEFYDIDKITMFADYRIPQILHIHGCLLYSPPLSTALARRRPLPPSSPWEIELRGCSIWCVELIRREIIRLHPHASLNAILIDFFLYDSMKEREMNGIGSGVNGEEDLPHHRTRSIWY